MPHPTKYLVRGQGGSAEGVILMHWRGVRVLRGKPRPGGPRETFEWLDIDGDAAIHAFNERLQALMDEGFREVTADELQAFPRAPWSRAPDFEAYNGADWTAEQAAVLRRSNFQADAFWASVKAWMRASPMGSVEAFMLAEPASDEAIDRLETVIGFELPRDFRDMYRVHNGQTDEEAPRFLPYGFMLPVEEIAAAWDRDFRHHHLQESFDNLKLGDRLRAMTVHPRWLPITSSATGSEHMVLDFVPGPRGHLGQVLIPTDEIAYIIAGKSLGDFCERYATLLGTNAISVKAEVDEDDGELVQIHLDFDEDALRIHTEDYYD